MNVGSDFQMKSKLLGTGDKSATTSRSQSQYPSTFTHAKIVDIFRTAIRSYIFNHSPEEHIKIKSQKRKKTYHYEHCQLCPKLFQFQHITTATSNHVLQPISFHRGIN